jgi:hypothetical protein
MGIPAPSIKERASPSGVFAAGANVMSSVTLIEPHQIDVLVEEYPAPLCAACNTPMWARRRTAGALQESTRLGFECRSCHAHLRIKGRKTVASVQRAATF